MSSKKKDHETVLPPDESLSRADLALDDLVAVGDLAQRKAKVQVPSRTGRQRSFAVVKPGETGYSVAAAATVRRAALRQVKAGETGSLKVLAEDLCRKLRFRPCEHLVVFAVDASDSMGGQARQRMQAAKGAVLSLLRYAYQGRHRIALVAFGGETARVVLPPTSSVSLAVERLRQLASGGATPMADGFQKALQLIQSERLKHPGIRPVLVVLSDGEANVPLVSGVPPVRELLALAEKIQAAKVTSVFLDAAVEKSSGGAMRALASRMGATYRALGELRARQILEGIRDGLR